MATQAAGSTSNATLPQELIDAMQALFGKHPGYRTTHAKGLLVEGVFTPTPDAQKLSVAAHFNSPSTPVVARFSVGGGIPHIADVDVNATPKGIAIRFSVDESTHTDLIAHSFNGFAAKNGEDFLAFLKIFREFGLAEAALRKAQAGGGDTSKEQKHFDEVQAEFGAFLVNHPSAAAFVQGVKPNPYNFGTITYYEPNTHVLTNKDGKVTNVRYRLDPQDGDHLYNNNDKDLIAQLGPNYLEDDIRSRFPLKPIVIFIRAHIANDDDVLDDATIPYKSTEYIPVGTLVINKVADSGVYNDQQIAFSPNPATGGIKGIAPSDDPLIQTRKGVYKISWDQRKDAKQTE
ncbi:catalase-like domain-containing protein [Xylaria palmicola]|nr:catalase-like domain-containing protein [Xylaria palmicola]